MPYETAMMVAKRVLITRLAKIAGVGVDLLVNMMKELFQQSPKEIARVPQLLGVMICQTLWIDFLPECATTSTPCMTVRHEGHKRSPT